MSLAKLRLIYDACFYFSASIFEALKYAIEYWKFGSQGLN